MRPSPLQNPGNEIGSSAEYGKCSSPCMLTLHGGVPRSGKTGLAGLDASNLSGPMCKQLEEGLA